MRLILTPRKLVPRILLPELSDAVRRSDVICLATRAKLKAFSERHRTAKSSLRSSGGMPHDRSVRTARHSAVPGESDAQRSSRGEVQGYSCLSGRIGRGPWGRVAGGLVPGSAE